MIIDLEVRLLKRSIYSIKIHCQNSHKSKVKWEKKSKCKPTKKNRENCGKSRTHNIFRSKVKLTDLVVHSLIKIYSIKMLVKLKII